MIKKIICLLILFPTISIAHPDSSTVLKKNTVYAEVGGNGIVYSLNYERVFYLKNKPRFCGRIGIAVFPQPFPGDGVAVVCPGEINLFWGGEHNFLEIGTGFTYNSVENAHLLIFRLGYRFQKPEGGFLFRIAATPVLSSEIDQPVFWAGLSVGYAF